MNHLLQELQHASNILLDGGVVAHACEGVWGLACDPWSKDAVYRILAIKQRPIAKGLILIGHDAKLFEEELQGLTKEKRDNVLTSWPGRVTWVVPTGRFPNWITGGHGGVALRIPNHQQALALCQSINGCLVSTSANFSNQSPLTYYDEVNTQFSDIVDYVLPGEINSDFGPSEIRDVSTYNRIR